MPDSSNARAFKIVIACRTGADALDWFDRARETGLVGRDAELYQADALDLGGRVDPRTFVVRRAGDRHARFSLRRLIGRQTRD